jgi:hypothetical protein
MNKMGRDLFGEDIVEVEDEVVEKRKKTSPFDFLGSISDTKKDIIAGNPDIADEYPPYLVNRGLGYFPDTVLYANEMNLYPDIPKKAQYYYYLASIRKRTRRSKWFKRETNDDIEMIKEVYNVRSEVAKQYIKLLTPENLNELRRITDTDETLTKKARYK